MLCLICRQAELANGVISAVFERDETRITINNIPAQVCPKCGDAVLVEDIAIHLLDAAQKMLDAGVIEGARDFQRL
jgi:YgiT-type zinc finger domain-containing protein